MSRFYCAAGIPVTNGEAHLSRGITAWRGGKGPLLHWTAIEPFPFGVDVLEDVRVPNGATEIVFEIAP